MAASIINKTSWKKNPESNNSNDSQSIIFNDTALLPVTYAASSLHAFSESSRLCDCANSTRPLMPECEKSHFVELSSKLTENNNFVVCDININNDNNAEVNNDDKALIGISTDTNSRQHDEHDEVDEEKRQFIILIDKSGNGLVHYIDVINSTGDRILVDDQVRLDNWPVIERRIDFQVCLLNGDEIYIIGGWSNTSESCLSSVDVYNVETNDWRSASNLHIERSDFASTVLKNRIFVAGGKRFKGRLTSSCEIYDSLIDQWTKVGRLPEPRSGLVMVGTKQLNRDFIYVSGGCQGSMVKNNFWCYESLKWSELDKDYPQKIPTNLQKHNMIVVDGIVYFIGGLNRNKKGLLQSPSVARLDAFSHRITLMDANKKNPEVICPWNFTLPPMKYERHSAAAVVLGENIVLFGGCGRNNKQVCHVEAFNVKSKRWKCLFKLPYDGEYGNVSGFVLDCLPFIEKETSITEEKNDKLNTEEHKTQNWILW